MTDDIPKEVKIALLKQDITVWQNTRYINEVRHRVNLRIGNKEAADGCVVELEKCEKALDAYKAELEALEKET